MIAEPPCLIDPELVPRIAAFVANASLEVTPRDQPRLPELARLLPRGASVYVAHPKSAALDDVVRTALALRSLGLDACPHLAARAMRSEAHLADTLSALRVAGIDRILLIGGDHDQPAGPFGSTLQVLETGAPFEFGMRRIGFAAHPEGNRAIGPSLLWDALRLKQDAARAAGVDAYLVTQFGFNPLAILEWERLCAERDITLPVHVGMAGPTPLSRLMRYAMQFGIGASLRAIMKNASPLANAIGLATTPDAMLVGLLAGGPGQHTRAVQPHFFSFGGCIETATWLAHVRRGEFTLRPNGRGFSVGAADVRREPSQ